MISQKQAEEIEAQITDIENRTRAEISAVVVKRSSAVGHVPWVMMCLLGFIFLSIEGLRFSWQEGLAAVGILFLSFYLARFNWVQRLLTPNPDEVEQVQQRAELEFYRLGLNKTDEGVGVLIFISLMERRAVIMADHGVVKVCPENIWQKTVEEMLKEFHRGDFTGGLELAVRHCGEVLSEKLPLRAPRTGNQLPNRVFLRYD